MGSEKVRKDSLIGLVLTSTITGSHPRKLSTMLQTWVLRVVGVAKEPSMIVDKARRAKSTRNMSMFLRSVVLAK